MFSDLTESGTACFRLVRQISPSLPQAQLFSLSVFLPVYPDSCALLADGAGVLLDQAKIIFVHLGLTSLAELEKVAFEDSLEGRDLVACEDSNASRSSWLRPKRTQKALASLLSTMQGSPQEHTTCHPTDHARFCVRRASWPRVMSRCRRNDVGGGEHPVSSQASPRWKMAQCDRWWVPCGSSPAPRLLVGASGHDEGRLRRQAWTSVSVVGSPKQCAKGEIAFTVRLG